MEVLRWLADWGVVRVSEGESQDDYVDRGRDGDCLLTVDQGRLGSLTSAQRPLTEIGGSADLIDEGEYPPTDEGRRARVRHTLARRLVEDPVVYVDELSEEERGYFLAQRPTNLTRSIEEATGLRAEHRAEGTAFVDPERKLTDTRFPGRGLDRQLPLLLCPFLAAELEAGRAEVSAPRLRAAVRELLRAPPRAVDRRSRRPRRGRARRRRGARAAGADAARRADAGRPARPAGGAPLPQPVGPHDPEGAVVSERPRALARLPRRLDQRVRVRRAGVRVRRRPAAAPRPERLGQVEGDGAAVPVPVRGRHGRGQARPVRQAGAEDEVEPADGRQARAPDRLRLVRAPPRRPAPDAAVRDLRRLPGRAQGVGRRQAALLPRRGQARRARLRARRRATGGRSAASSCTS